MSEPDTYVDHDGVERCTRHGMVAAWCVDCQEQGVRAACGVVEASR